MSRLPILRSDLSERAVAFLQCLAKTGSVALAEKEAGYAPGSGYHVARDARGQELIEKELHGVLKAEGAPLAVKVLLQILRDEEMAPRIRVDAAKIVLDRSGFAPPKAGEGDDATKTLADMSPDELRAFIDERTAEINKVEGELAARATPVDAPNEGDTDANLLELLD